VALRLVQPLLAAPADLDHHLGHPRLALFQRLALRRLEPRVVGRLAQDLPEQPVAGRGDVALRRKAPLEYSLGTRPT
jgi:hypothetical protein